MRAFVHCGISGLNCILLHLSPVLLIPPFCRLSLSKSSVSVLFVSFPCYVTLLLLFGMFCTFLCFFPLVFGFDVVCVCGVCGCVCVCVWVWVCGGVCGCVCVCVCVCLFFYIVFLAILQFIVSTILDSPCMSPNVINKEK